MPLGKKTVGEISVQELRNVALALVGNSERIDGIMPLLNELQRVSPDAKPIDLLGTDAAQKIFKRLLDKAQEAQEESRNMVFCTCPFCERNFETELS